MAITQSRLISLIAAAEDYQQALLSFREQAYALARNYHDGAMSAHDALEGILLELQNAPMRLKFPHETTATLADEKSYFRTNAKRNVRAAEVARKKRRALGAKEMPPTREGLIMVPIARTAPSQLDNTGGSALDREVEAEYRRLLEKEKFAGANSEEPSDKDVEF